MLRAGMTTAAILLLLVAGGLALLAANEGKFIYFPSRAYDAAPEDYALSAEPLEISSPGGPRLRGWWIRGNGKIALLYYHGNGGNISHRLERTKSIVDALGADVALVDYRGYGRSDGRPSERGLYADGGAIYEAARARGFPPERIVLFGESLGCAVAVEVAARKPVRAILLEAPFLSVPKMAKVVYPFLPAFLIRTRFDNEAKIGRLRVPVLIAGADHDDVVPFEQTRRLYELAREPKTFFVVPGATHNNIYIVGGKEYLEAWRRFFGEQ
jgi:fermentation-respiration switch protein FrsA (DUF1100 family)